MYTAGGQETMDDQKKDLLLSRDVGTLLMNVNRRENWSSESYGEGTNLEPRYCRASKDVT